MSTSGATGSNSSVVQPIKKLANAGEAFEKYKIKMQEKTERVRITKEF